VIWREKETKKKRSQLKRSKKRKSEDWKREENIISYMYYKKYKIKKKEGKEPKSIINSAIMMNYAQHTPLSMLLIESECSHLSTQMSLTFTFCVCCCYYFH
jgi:hypothetical protein